MSRTRRQMIDGRDEGGNTDLMRAALNGQRETVKALLLDGADVNARNHEGRTALLFAIVNLHASTVQTLLEQQAETLLLSYADELARLTAAKNSAIIDEALRPEPQVVAAALPRERRRGRQDASS